MVGPSVKIHVNFSRQSRSATASLSLSCTRRRKDSLLPSIRTDWVERFRTWQPHMDSYRNREMGKTLSSHTYIASTFNCMGARKEPNSNNFEIPGPGPETRGNITQAVGSPNLESGSSVKSLPNTKTKQGLVRDQKRLASTSSPPHWKSTCSVRSGTCLARTAARTGLLRSCILQTFFVRVSCFCFLSSGHPKQCCSLPFNQRNHSKSDQEAFEMRLPTIRDEYLESEMPCFQRKAAHWKHKCQPKSLTNLTRFFNFSRGDVLWGGVSSWGWWWWWLLLLLILTFLFIIIFFRFLRSFPTPRLPLRLAHCPKTNRQKTAQGLS